MRVLPAAGRWFLLLVCGLAACARVPQERLQAAVDPLNEKKYVAAIARLAALRVEYPDNPQIPYYLAYSHLKNHNYRQALHFFDVTLKLRRGYDAAVGDADFANFLAGNSQSINDDYFRLAELELRKIIQSTRGSETAKRIQLHRAHFHAMKMDYAGAIAILRETLAMPPVGGELHRQALLVMAGIYLTRLDNEAEGERCYRQLAELDPGSAEALEAGVKLGDHYAGKLRLYQARQRDLAEFARQWERNPAFAGETAAAKRQAEGDARLAELYHAKAVDAYKPLAERSGHRFYAQAGEKLRRLQDAWSAGSTLGQG